jgi:hypothetical protein
MQQALEFIEHCWRDVSLNDYSEAMRSSAENALNAALKLPDVQQVIAPPQSDITDLLARLEAAEADAARYWFVKNSQNLCVAEWGTEECEWFDVDERRVDEIRSQVMEVNNDR